MLSNAFYELTGTMDVKDTDQFQFVLKMIHSLKKQVSMKRKDPVVDMSDTNNPMKDNENDNDKSGTATSSTNSSTGGLPFPNLISASRKKSRCEQKNY